jgi:LuxR family maltose regulon positive regulatory protein
VIPRTRDHVRREALLAEIGERHRRSPITWVVGLPGAGKTSVVARFVEELDRNILWYRLDERDGDGASLLDALNDKGQLPVWSPENQVEVGDFARLFFGEMAQEQVTVVFDDCHRVADDAAVLTMLEAIAEVCGANLRIIAVSRRRPPPSLARGEVGGWLGVIDDLRLSTEETRAIAGAVGGRAVSGDELDTADGWLAHVLALAHGRKQPLDGKRIGDFLAAELLASLPDERRAGLRRLAELPEIRKQQAPRGFQQRPRDYSPRSRRSDISWISARIFVSMTSCAMRFCASTQPRIRRTSCARCVVISRRGSPTWCPRRRCSSARSHAIRPVRSRCSTSTAVSGLRMAATARSTIGSSPSRKAPSSASAPRSHSGARNLWCRSSLKPRDRCSQKRVVSARFWAMLVLLTLPGAARVASYVIQWGAVQGLADLVDVLEQLHEELGPEPDDLLLRTSADALTALMYGRAEDPRIGRFAEATARAVMHAPDAGARISAAAQLLVYKLWWAGDFPGGRAIYDAFDAEVEAGEHLAALPRLLWWSCASIVDWQCGTAARCYAKVERGLALASSSGVHVRDFFLLTQGIFCALSQEDWPRAEAYLAQLARTERRHKRLDAMVHHFFRSWYSLCRGDARTALAHAETAWPIAEAIGSMFHKVIVLSALSPARLHAGDIEGADAAYREQIVLAKAAQNPTFSFIAFCAGAEIAIARGDEARTKKQVERMLMVKELGDFHSCCGWRTSMMRDVLSFALANDIHPAIARKWFREKKISPPAAPPPGWPMPVSIVVNDGLRVEVLDRTEPAPGAKTARKLRELVAVLVVEREGALQSDLLDWLWPDADGDKAAASLKAATHRLRQWLGADAVRVQDGRTRLSPDVVECDLWRDEARDPERMLQGFDLPPVNALRAELRRRSP